MAEPREDRTDRSRTSQENDSPTSTRAETEEPAFKYEAGQRAQSSSSTAAPAAQPQMEEQPAKPKPSKLQQIWKKIDLDIGTLLMMFKGSVPPLIGIAFYQADSVASTFTSLGYLVPIITVLCMAIMPRAKYFQTLILNTLGVCVGSAVALLGIWTGVKARENTTAPGSTATYNSSQSAVCGIWLFANIWFVNVLRAKFPALAFPVIMYSIFSNIAFTYGPLFPNIAAGESLIKQLLTGFLTAFGISTGVNLFIIPVSSRTVVFKEQAGYIMALRGTIKATAAYITSLETSDMFAPPVVEDNGHSKKKSKKDDKENGSHPANNIQAIALKGAIAGLTGLHGKLHGDMSFAKREMAWGKLDANDIEEIFTLFRSIIIPLIGLSTIVDIFERIAERRGWVKTTRKSQYDELESWERCPESEEADEKRIWNGIMKTLHEPFAVASQAMDEGLEHVGYVLELIPKPKKKKGDDVEAANNTEAKPGDAVFADYLDQKMRDFYGKRGETLKTWAREKGLSEDAFNSAQKMPQPEDPKDMTPDSAQHRRDQQQLYLLLYLEHLLYSTGTAIADLVRFADKKVESGAMKKKKLIVPGKRRLKKWILSIGNEDSSADHESPDSLEGGNNNIYMGAGFNPKKDPEHLPPTTAWQKFGNGLRVIPRFLGSTESAFGFRVACATLTIGIIAFLKDTQTFFIQQRLVWAMIIIAIGMTMTSGQSMFGFFGRIAGTALAMVFSIVIYYIVDGHTAGVIVMLWFFIFMEMYFFLKFPRFIPVWLVCIVTQVLILGYELQVRKIGYEAASRGQPYYPVYELAPYRLACVAGGSFVAFIWTIFPYPLSDRSWLRKDLGSTLYLLANYYSVIHTTIGARMHNAEGDMGLKSSPGRRLEKVRHHIFGKLLLLLPSVKQHADWQKWEITIGGKFPKESYDGVTLRATNIMNYLSLMSYATTTWAKANEAEKETPETKSVWLRDLAALVDSIGPTSHEITSILSLLSASVKTGTALPPYLRVPKPYQLSQRLEQLDPNILDAKHVTEPGYSAYAVMQVASSLVVDDLERLVEHVRDLVGETDFSFKVVMSESTIVGSESGDKGKRD